MQFHRSATSRKRIVDEIGDVLVQQFQRRVMVRSDEEYLGPSLTSVRGGPLRGCSSRWTERSAHETFVCKGQASAPLDERVPGFTLSFCC